MFLFRPFGRMILFLAADGVAEFLPPLHQIPDENRPFEPWDFQNKRVCIPLDLCRPDAAASQPRWAHSIRDATQRS